MNASDVQVLVRMDPGEISYLLEPSTELAEHSFREVFTGVKFQEQFARHSPIAGTTIDLVITGLSVGAGIVAVEFLKECGKDLWKAFRGFGGRDQTAAALTGDNINVTVKLGDSTFTASVRSLGRGDERRLEEFLTHEMPQLARLPSTRRAPGGTHAYESAPVLKSGAKPKKRKTVKKR